MDCVIPGHAVKTFCASIGCLSRIGKDLYLEFDAIDGLAFRTLNDAKSAYSCFRFEPSFFEKCTSNETNTNNRKRQHASSSSTTTTTASHQEGDDGDEDDSSSRFACRVALSALAAVVKARKNVVALRIQSETANSTMYLLFEFHLQPKYSSHHHHENNHNNNNNGTTPSSSDHILRVVHRIPVSGQVQSQSAVAPRDGSSEIVTSNPKLLLHLLDPLKKTAEAALIVRSHTLSATSFHHSDATAAAAAAAAAGTTSSKSRRNRNSGGASNDTSATTTATTTTNNAILQANTASLLKTETGTNSDEFDEFYFRDDHGQDDDDKDNNVYDNMPDNVNSQVVLVFPIKEAKAMLQFCAAQSSSVQAREWAELLQVHVHFHWGGRPISFGTKTDSFSAELVLATLDYKLLGPLGTSTSTSSAAAAEGRSSNTANDSRGRGEERGASSSAMTTVGN